MAFRDENGYKRKQTDMKSTTTTTSLAISGVTATSPIKDQYKLEGQVEEDILIIKTDCKHSNELIKL